MKLNKISFLLFAGVALAACSDIDDIEPEGSTLTEEQSKETNAAIPQRAEATFASMYSMMGQPCTVFTSSSRPDDYGFVMMAMSNDLEGADVWFPNSGYNWFSVCGEYTSRNANYANPYIRYMTPYNQIRIANEVINSFDEASATQDQIYQLAQAHAIRAFDYMQAAPSFQFNYADHKAEACVPIVPETTIDYANNPRASLDSVYSYIINELNYAVKKLEGYKRTDKSRIDKSVALGLRARAKLAMADYEGAAQDAEAALKAGNYQVASAADVSHPAFCSLNESNWMWGVAITKEMASRSRYSTACSWISPFSSWAYSAGVAVYASINNLLYDKIPASDVRKGWWMDENNQSPLLEGLTWGDLEGQAIASGTIEDVKMPFYQYASVKFGMKSGIGSEVNDNDWPLMRAEEMYLILAECAARSATAGGTAKAEEILVNFVQQNRDPKYDINGRGLSLLDEIWFQRRVELWGEGFFVYDAIRLKKPIVRFHEGQPSAFPDAFQFNLAADDPYRLMRFPQSEIDTNFGIVDNKGGLAPVQGQNGGLRDGVTD